MIKIETTEYRKLNSSLLLCLTRNLNKKETKRDK